MSAPRLLVIDPSVNHAEDEGVREVLVGASESSRVSQPVLRPGDGPGAGSPYDFDGVVLLGSAASVHEDAPWMRELSAWLRPILDGERRIPLLGVCFGHQLLAHLAGAPVGFLSEDRAKRVGIERTSMGQSRLIGEPVSLRVVVSHREEVKRVPRGYRRIAERENCAIDGLEHDSLAIHTVQFHPEARGDFLSSAGIDLALLDEELARDSRRLLDRFVARCRVPAAG